ncbi:MAG: SipW-dependent-type signal peptide-containing protein [Lachnospiraceae bacterium]
MWADREAMAIGGTMAYLTDSEQTSNTLPSERSKLTLKKPVRDTTDNNNNDVPDQAETMVPNQELDKNPQVENTGS